jgi:hypothetical protein
VRTKNSRTMREKLVANDGIGMLRILDGTYILLYMYRQSTMLSFLSGDGGFGE